LLRVAPWVESAMVPNGTAYRYRYSPCRTEYPVGSDEHLQNPTRAVELPVCRDERSGRLSHEMLKGEHHMTSQEVIVTVTGKHRLVPWAAVEAQLR
jgi:hypothetical protein